MLVSSSVYHTSISIHVPHTRYDKKWFEAQEGFEVFQSTYLIRGTTVCSLALYEHINISIHVPHTRYDLPNQL